MLEEALKDIAKDVVIEDFNNSQLAEYMRKVLSLIEQTQDHVQALDAKSGEEDLTLMKVGTIVTLAIVGNAFSGKKPADYTEDDWKEIAKGVSQYAILMDDQAYSMLIFDIYADYIDASVKKYDKLLSNKAKVAIGTIASEIRDKGNQLKAGLIKEVDYTEDCLWLCLEAMIKLLSAFYSSKLGKEYAELAQAITSFGFECAKYNMYKQRQELLAMYLANQKVVDEELQTKYDSYIFELNEQSRVFNKLIDDAFNSDFRNSLRNTVELARFAGVNEEEILKTTSDVDDFFLN